METPIREELIRFDRKRTSKLKLVTERHTYCLKWDQPFRVMCWTPKTRFSIQMQPSMPTRKRCLCRYTQLQSTMCIVQLLTAFRV